MSSYSSGKYSVIFVIPAFLIFSCLLFHFGHVWFVERKRSGKGNNNEIMLNVNIISDYAWLKQ